MPGSVNLPGITAAITAAQKDPAHSRQQTCDHDEDEIPWLKQPEDSDPQLSLFPGNPLHNRQSDHKADADGRAT